MEGGGRGVVVRSPLVDLCFVPPPALQPVLILSAGLETIAKFSASARNMSLCLRTGNGEENIMATFWEESLIIHIQKEAI